MRETASFRAALDTACMLLQKGLPFWNGSFWSSSSTNGFYKKTGNFGWTTGFCTGEYWLAYEHTGDEAFCKVAMQQVDSFLTRIEQKQEVNHHDMGFLYTPSCVAAYKLKNSQSGRIAALKAAQQLATRFREVGKFIQAWGELGEKDEYRLIIDCLMNLPLLYWASEETGDDRYRQIALKHTQTSLQNLVREDHSTYHTYFFDLDTGTPLYGVTRQGYCDDSAWARGQAWGIYGLALSYRYTQNEECIKLFNAVTDYFISHLPEDDIPYWDLAFTQGREPRDSSAAAIAACGMLEMAQYLPENSASYYKETAKRIAAALIRDCSVKKLEESNGLLLHGVYAKSSPYNPIPEDNGVDECNAWGDYFYMELLTRLTRQWTPYW